MKAAPFRYERPRNLDEALEMLQDEDAKPLAGGQSLVPMMAMRLARPSVLVDLSAIAELDGIERRDGGLVTGAMTRQRTLERRAGVIEELPLVAAALPYVGHREIRNRGTVGGSIAHADPAAELGLVAATLRATIVAQGPDGTRDIPADHFVSGPFQTALAAGELLTAVRWPLAQPEDRFAFAEVARRHGDFALCGAAVHLHGREPRSVRGGLLGVGPAPVVHEAQVSDAEGIAELAEQIASGLEPSSDMHATAGYRRRLARVLLERCMRAAWSGAGG
ncbi:MAG: xanthine dehydrogenase family protein subunit M [Solirubrobacterales bacterium]|nr:xanthine dehydrogenase family protein subunit M [Solirubrobacterales bacterium]